MEPAGRSTRLLVGFLLCIASTIVCRISAVDWQFQQRQAVYIDSDVLQSPGRPVLKLATMEHPFGWADVVWLQIVQELARPLEGGKATWSRVDRWAHIVTDLDPLYMTVYHAAAIYLSVFANEVDASDALAKKGWAAIPQAWQLPFLLGYNAYFVRGDPIAASEWFLQASRIDGSPRYLPALAGRALSHGGDERGAIALLEIMIPQLEGPARTDAEQRLAMLESEPRLSAYDAACKRFKAEKGHAPKDGQALREAGYIDAPAEDLLGYPIEFSDEEECLAVTELIRVREHIARARVGSRRGGGGVDVPDPTDEGVIPAATVEDGSPSGADPASAAGDGSDASANPAGSGTDESDG